jgi:integrase
LRAADPWSFSVHFLLAKLGVRPGELLRILIEDVDFGAQWVRIRSRPELGARTKTRGERNVPMIAEAAQVMKHMIGDRQAGPVILRQKVNPAGLTLFDRSSQELAAAVEHRTMLYEEHGAILDRRAVARICGAVWHDAGATSADRIREIERALRQWPASLQLATTKLRAASAQPFHNP